ncbi:hypothetical protein [Streptobacillus canis]|uniref:hypothetical protein n=1 Tax=Streptobacillus canis TaxID=2678686 RepID=UPI0012E1E6D4|nr:hypothetical protein [Streptobacillus canis]
MQQKNRLISIFILSLLLIMMNNKALSNTSYNYQINRMITTVLKIEKKENEDIKIENNENKFFLEIKKVDKKNVFVFFWNKVFTYSKINGRNNLKYLE